MEGEELDPRKVDELHARIELHALAEEMLQDMIELGIVRYEPDTDKYLLAVDADEGRRRLGEYQRLRRGR